MREYLEISNQDKTLYYQIEGNIKGIARQEKTDFLWERKLRAAKACVGVYYVNLSTLFNFLIKPYACISLKKKYFFK